MISYFRTAVNALGFLTRLPLPSSWFVKDKTVAEISTAFPLAGLLLGLFHSLLLWLFMHLNLGTALSASLSLIILIIVTGALHEDGLSDVMDGFFGKRTVGERLDVMKDSRIGTFGTLALIASFSLRVLIVMRLIDIGLSAAFCSLIMLESASRTMMVYFWGSLPLARSNGIAAAAGEPNYKDRLFALFVFFILLFLLTWLPLGFAAFFGAFLLSFLGLYGFSLLCKNKISGYTGDTLGAFQQISWGTLAIGLLIGYHLGA